LISVFCTPVERRQQSSPRTPPTMDAASHSPDHRARASASRRPGARHPSVRSGARVGSPVIDSRPSRWHPGKRRPVLRNGGFVHDGSG
jgi:hypothetical protein